MIRDFSKIKSNFDVLIIGSGIVGAAAALDATLRGLSVCLVDKGDFGGATSAASGKMIHGGIRFMQHAKFLRVRESLHHRKVFLNIAPHLVHPIPFVIPTYGHGMKGKEILTAAMILYELLGVDKNKTKDSSKDIHRFKVLSKEETLLLESEINEEGLTGSILYYDCQMHTPERLTLAFVQSANENGAEVYNYVKVDDLIISNSKVIGVRATDVLSGKSFEINSNFIINASGPWITKLLNGLSNFNDSVKIQFSKGIHLVTKSITNNNAIALATKHKQAKSLLTRGGRHFFIAPWKNLSLIGTTNVDFNGDQDEPMVTRKDIEDFLAEIKDSYKPASKLTIDDIKYCYGGLYIDDANIKFNKGYQGHRRDQIFDHLSLNKVDRLISVIGVKYTTSLHLAEKVVDKVVSRIKKGERKSSVESYSLYGGNIFNYNEFVENSINKYSSQLDKEIIKNLILLYGSKFEDVINLGLKNTILFERINKNLPYIKAQIVYSIKEEMALKLTDIFLRRIGIGTIEKPTDETINIVTEIMAKELDWNNEKIESEISELKAIYTLD